MLKGFFFPAIGIAIGMAVVLVAVMATTFLFSGGF